ncbi:MAG: homocysteine S-methyltransferase family protein [Planctomycetota bacterium]
MLINELIGGGPVITDGAWRTQLQLHGLAGGGCPDQWNLSKPEIVERVPRDYVRAGSQIVLTNTFRANRIALESYALADQTVDINRIGVDISRRAVGDQAYVFATMGPSGKMLLMGEVSKEDLQQAFEEQANALAAAGTDAIVVETMADIEEAEVALRAAKNTGLPVVACVVFDSGPQGDCTMTGVTPEQAAQWLDSAGADVVGANCGSGIETHIGICQRMNAVTDKPLWIKPNAGTPEMINGEVTYRTEPREFAAHAPALVEAGAQFVGGCCGTGPEFIKALCQTVLGRTSQQQQV